MCQDHGTPSNHVMTSHTVEHSPSILYAPTFGVHVNKSITHKYIRLITIMICLWAFLPSSRAATIAHAFSSPTKVTCTGCTPLHCISQNSSNAFCACPHFNMSQNHGTPRDYILCGHSVEHSPSIIYAPTFGVHVNEATPHKDISFKIALNHLLMNMPAVFKCS